MWFDLPDLVRSLLSQKGRALSTFLGIVWGTLSVVLLLAFGLGMQREFEERGEGFGKSIVVVWPASTTKPYAGLPEGRRIRLTEKDVLDLAAQIPEIDRISPEYTSRINVQVGQRIQQVTLAGVRPDYADLRSMYPSVGGRFLNERDVAETRRVVFLGNAVRDALFGTRPAVGQTVVLQSAPFRVVGVLAPKKQDSNYEGSDEFRACIPSTTYAKLFRRQFVTNFVFHSRDPDRREAVIRSVYEVLGRRKQFDPDDVQALSTWDSTEQETMLFYIFLTLNVMMGTSGVLTLIVGGIGVGNLMFIMVRQRTREIGIQMALGARPRDILVGIVGEALILVAAGGCVGFFISWLITSAAARSDLTEQFGVPKISPLVTVITLTVLGTIGLLAGYFPARRAARLDPVRALTE